jgi:hypothetical protein
MRMTMIGPMRVVGGATVHTVKPAANCYVTNIHIPDVEIMKLKAPPLDMEVKVNDLVADMKFGFMSLPVASGDDLTFTFSEPIECFVLTIYVPEGTDMCANDEFKQWIANRPNKQKATS